MGKQLHTKFTDEFVKFIFQKYVEKKITLEQALDTLEIKRRRFYGLLKTYKGNPNHFSVKYKRGATNKISPELERIILRELKKEQKLIDNKEIPIKKYNYSYIKDIICKKYNKKVSLHTIIKRAKENNFYIPKKARKKHEREVLTNYPGELIQHDSSHHKFSPYAENKWYLITSLDDYSRYMLYADLIERETSWKHILALERVFLSYGIPLSYYVDCHSIFRFVQGRDSIWRNHKKLTDDIEPQWKQILNDFNVKVTYALSPQAKGKIERPYRWLQDRIVRTCARENIKRIKEAQEVLKYEIDRYNNHQVHSTTKEVPVIRFQRALEKNHTLFRNFKIPYPYYHTKDLFCFRDSRTVDGYHKIKYHNIEILLKRVPVKQKVDIRIFPDFKRCTAELRIWYKNNLVEIRYVKLSDLNIGAFS